MNDMVTTSLKPSHSLVEEALTLAESMGGSYVERRKQSIKSLVKRYGGLFLLAKDKLSFEQSDGRSLFFHPDTAMLRIKAQHDPLRELVTGFETVLDTTMGLASDSLVMAAAGAKVTALEVSPVITQVVAYGLSHSGSAFPQLAEASKRVTPICTDNLDYLKKAPDSVFDVIYVDPMFSETITESHNLDGLAHLADSGPMTAAFFEEAKRVARHRIIIKAHFRDDVFERFGFKRLVRPNQKFHYGIYDLDG